MGRHEEIIAKREAERRARRETELAAAEAGAIGGHTPEQELPPEEQPLAQSGEGVSEGWEQAEEELRENAEHGDGTAEPVSDRYPPERESDRSTAEYAEADDWESTEIIGDQEGA